MLAGGDRGSVGAGFTESGKSDDKEAKAKLKALLENGTVASLVGAGATKLLGLL